jgi:hypothetical protein
MRSSSAMQIVLFCEKASIHAKINRIFGSACGSHNFGAPTPLGKMLKPQIREIAHRYA